MNLLSIKVTKAEEKVIRRYCRLHGISISEAFKEALFERIEDEFDVKEFDSALEEYEKNPITHSLEKLREAFK